MFVTELYKLETFSLMLVFNFLLVCPVKETMPPLHKNFVYHNAFIQIVTITQYLWIFE